MLRTAYLLTGDRGQAEDVLQQALLRTARRWRAAQAEPDAYAHRVLINLLHDRRRMLGRRVSEAPLESVSLESLTRVDHIAGLIERDAILAAVRGLSPRQREVLVLRYYADLSVEETAAAMGASTGSVKTHTRRALERLRVTLGEHAREGREVPDGER